MAGSKATLGFGSRTAAVQALRAQNMSTRAIASKIGIEPKTVTALEASARRHQTADNERWANGDQALFPTHVRQLLRPHAVRRGLSLDRLIADIVATVAECDLVDAVLDDREGGAR